MRHAHAAGIATVTANGIVLDAWYPRPSLGPLPAELDPWVVPTEFEEHVGQRDELRFVETSYVSLEINLDLAPATIEDVYLRLHLLSHGLVRPGDINLDGVFAKLPSVVWTSRGPMLTDVYREQLPVLRRHGLTALGIDKFPRLTDYVVPAGVRIADASRVRLGAYLAPGTTVASEGFVNYNAGTLGAATVEGRLSQGVTVGEGSTIGGGASIMGTLTIGDRALLGANSGVGISIGDDSVVEAGLYVTAGTKVWLPAENTFVKAAQLSGAPKLLFRRNSGTGAVEALPRA